MYQAERGLFELRRGRAVLIHSPEEAPESSSGAFLVAAVEGLTPESLVRLRGQVDGELRLILTPFRAAAMGLEQAPSAAIRLRLPEKLTSDDLLRLATASGSTHIEASEFQPAHPGEVAGLTLVRMARLIPAVVAGRVGMDQNPTLQEDLRAGRTLRVSATAIEAFSQDPSLDVTFVSEAPVPLEEAENAHFILFREASGLQEHVAILIGDRASWPDPVPVRLHSACLTGDLFGSLRCDCGEQLRRSLNHFATQGGGVLLYLSQEGRSIGLANKFRAYSIQETGLDTVDADCTLGFGADERRYDHAVQMLRYLGISAIQLLTNNPEKMKAMEDAGIQVMDRKPLHGTLNRHNLPYVRAKVHRAGHWLQSMLAGEIQGS
jgi:GTP cyclohydrolase II